MDKNQRSSNPKLAATWERGTIIEIGATGTSYKVDRQDRKRKKVKTVNVQQLKPYEEEEEETVIAQTPPPVPHRDDKQQQPPEEHDLEGEDEEDLPDVDLGPEDEVSEEADPNFMETMRERLAVLKDTPLPEQETPLPGEQTPLPETPPQSEGMTTRAQTRAVGGGIKHVPGARTTRQQVHLTRPPPPARESTGQAQQEQQGLEDEDKLML
jgi:hypothetical protein